MKRIYPLFSIAMMVVLILMISGFVEKDRSPAPDQMVADWERAKAYTKEYIEAASEKTISYRPTPEMRSFAEQMLHLTQGNINIVSSATGKERIYGDVQLEKLDTYKNKEALLKVVMEGYDFVLAAIKEMPADKWDEKVTIFRWEMSRAEGVGKAFEHQTHHRGQTTVYLRMSGETPPSEKLF